MSQVFAIFLLMLFFFPALLSLLFASRSLVAIFWNFSWYFFLAKLGEMATQNTNGALIGVFFAVAYVLRISFFRSANPRNRFVFKRFNSQEWKAGSSQQGPFYSYGTRAPNEQQSSQFSVFEDPLDEQSLSKKDRGAPVILDAEFERK